jgi:hypothetical protein
MPELQKRGILSGISGEKQGFEEFRKQEMQARERENLGVCPSSVLL